MPFRVPQWGPSTARPKAGSAGPVELCAAQSLAVHTRMYEAARRKEAGRYLTRTGGSSVLLNGTAGTLCTPYLTDPYWFLTSILRWDRIFVRALALSSVGAQSPVSHQLPGAHGGRGLRVALPEERPERLTRETL